LHIFPTNQHFWIPFKSCDIILSIEVLTYFPILLIHV
jgi:hypothetical protein